MNTSFWFNIDEFDTAHSAPNHRVMIIPGLLLVPADGANHLRLNKSLRALAGFSSRGDSGV